MAARAARSLDSPHRVRSDRHGQEEHRAAAVAAPQIDIGIKGRDREKIAQGLSRVLADTYSLYLKTHNFHWNVEGPMFNTLHLMFMDQYTELWNALDAIAERIRSLGYPAPGTGKEFARLTSIEETEGVPEALDMVRLLVSRSRSRGAHRARSLPGRGEGRRRIDLRPADAAPADARKDRVDAAQPAEVKSGHGSARPDSRRQLRCSARRTVCLALFAPAPPRAEAQGGADLRRPAAQRHAAAGREAIRLRARHRQGAEEASHPAVLRIHQRQQARAQSGRRAGTADLGRRRPSARQPHLYAPRPHEEQRRGFPARNPAQRAGARVADAPGDRGRKHDWRWFRYPYLHEGDTLEKRRAVRAFLPTSGYRIAQTTLDFEDYLWNSAHARCWMRRRTTTSIEWLRESYRTAARDFIALSDRDIHARSSAATSTT